MMFFFVKQKTAYEMRISDWSSDVCSSDLDHVMAALMREGFDHKLPRPGQAGAASLHFQPFAHIGGKARPLRAVTQKPPHSPGKVGGHGHARSAPIWNAG